MDLSEFISRCQSDEIETFTKNDGGKRNFQNKAVCFENFIYYLRNERWSDARVFRSGAIKEYLMLPSNRKFPKHNKDNQAIDSDSLRKRVNHVRDSDQKKGRKTETELSVGISDNKKSETADQARSQTELDANKTMEVEKGPILSEETESQANSESYEEENRRTGSESELANKYENENKSNTRRLEAIEETNSIENSMAILNTMILNQMKRTQTQPKRMKRKERLRNQKIKISLQNIC
ncbi:hypothetical protein ACJMK2_031204 [Sinanodonta woodiana]|uniref:Uncharacterized protein n=1 Tax=Sinanodonta woodiana TaxID=1069815 RepID=A0ABD3WZS8_SINWO